MTAFISTKESQVPFAKSATSSSSNAGKSEIENTSKNTNALTMPAYGVQSEKSDIHVHVAPGTRLVMAVMTSELQMVMWNYPEAVSETFRGRKVPLGVLNSLRYLQTKPEWWGMFHPSQHWDSPSVKGDKARQLLTQIIDQGWFFVWPHQQKITDEKAWQLDGEDILLKPLRLQVKCDWIAGPKEKGGSGNIFAQTHETNQFGRY